MLQIFIRSPLHIDHHVRIWEFNGGQDIVLAPQKIVLIFSQTCKQKIAYHMRCFAFDQLTAIHIFCWKFGKK